MGLQPRQEERLNNGLCIYCGQPRGGDGTSRFCRPCADKNSERSLKHYHKMGPKKLENGLTTLQAERVKSGLCKHCAAPRGEDGTSQFCRPCADKNNVRTKRCHEKRASRGLCISCGEPKPPGVTTRTCPSCIQNVVALRERQTKARGRKPATFICVDGVCVNCGKKTGGDTGYEACKLCYYKLLARMYLKSSWRWREIRDMWRRQDGRCPYTGIKLDFGIDASLDHIKPSSRFPELAHEVSNLEFVHIEVNKMKRDMDKEEFLAFIRVIAMHSNLVP